MQCKHEGVVPINPDYFSGKDRLCCGCGLVSSDGISWEVVKESRPVRASIPTCKHKNTGTYISEVTKKEVTHCADCGMVLAYYPQDDAPKGSLMPSLDEANTIVNGGRQDQYGSPENSFEIIAGYWNVFLRQKIKEACDRNGLDVVDIDDLLSPLDATNMMVLFKQARKLGQMPKRDNYVDSIGYEAIGADRLWRA